MKKILIPILFVLFLLDGYAQSSLTVKCGIGTTAQEILDNHISIDGDMVEYSACTLHPSFYVSVIDTACNAWATYHPDNLSGYSIGNINDNANGCRPWRAERYFIYHQDELDQLESLDSLLNYLIPDDHVVAIWTPFSFDFTSIHALCPALGNTLVNKWGTGVQTNSAIILFGIEGDAVTFSVDSLTSGNNFSITKTICDTYAGLQETTLDGNKERVKVVDLMGREIEDKPNTLMIYVYSDGTTKKVFRTE